MKSVGVQETKSLPKFELSGLGQIPKDAGDPNPVGSLSSAERWCQLIIYNLCWLVFLTYFVKLPRYIPNHEATVSMTTSQKAISLWKIWNEYFISLYKTKVLRYQFTSPSVQECNLLLLPVDALQICKAKEKKLKYQWFNQICCKKK